MNPRAYLQELWLAGRDFMIINPNQLTIQIRIVHINYGSEYLTSVWRVDSTGPALWALSEHDKGLKPTVFPLFCSICRIFAVCIEPETVAASLGRSPHR